jgi:hypothetical protein
MITWRVDQVAASVKGYVLEGSPVTDNDTDCQALEQITEY